MCDEGRFGWKYVHDPKRLTRLVVRRGADEETPEWEELPKLARFRFDEVVADAGSVKVGAILSPFMSCEEAWLLARFIREIAPNATLAMGPVPVTGEDEAFPGNHNGDGAKFTIRAEKCPNRRGVEMILAALGGTIVSCDDFVKQATAGGFSAAWIVGGSPTPWVTKEWGKAAGAIGELFVQDLFANAVTKAASVVVPGCSFAERSGTFVNHAGQVQPFEAAIAPVDGCRRDGQFLYTLAGGTGLYNAARVREQMAEAMPAFADLHVPPAKCEYAH